MLILNKVKQLGCVGLSHKLERLYLQGCGQLANDIHCLLASEGLLQKLLGITDTTLCYVLLCQTDLIKLLNDLFLNLRGNTPGIGNFQCQLFNFFFL